MERIPLIITNFKLNLSSYIMLRLKMNKVFREYWHKVSILPSCQSLKRAEITIRKGKTVNFVTTGLIN